jgi:hypothetical protein
VRVDVSLVSLQREDARLLLVVELELGFVREWLLGVPVVGVLHERGADLRLVTLELPGPGPVEGLLEVPVVARGEDDRVVVVGAHDVRETTVRRIERELDRRLVDRLRVPLGKNPAEGGERLRAHLRIRQPVIGCDDVLGGHRRPVVVLDALTDLEGPHAAVVVRLPALGELGLELELVVRKREVLRRLAEHAEPALVGDGDGIDCTRGRLDRDADGPACLGLACLAVTGRLGAASTIVPAARGREE